jgi:hypothetical protein
MDWQLRRSRSSREPVVIYCQLPAIEIQLLRNGPEVEDSIVDIVVTGLESLSERDATRGAATDRRVVYSRCRRAIDVTGTFVLIRSDVPASTVRQQGRYTMADSTTTDQVTGPGWLMVGDAGCFGDPMFSGEVLLAMATAARAGTTITQALADANITTSRDKLEMCMVRLLGGDFWSAYNPIATALRANKQWDTFAPGPFADYSSLTVVTCQPESILWTTRVHPSRCPARAGLLWATRLHERPRPSEPIDCSATISHNTS